jgi:hypothetical protein
MEFLITILVAEMVGLERDITNWNRFIGSAIAALHLDPLALILPRDTGETLSPTIFPRRMTPEHHKILTTRHADLGRP